MCLIGDVVVVRVGFQVGLRGRGLDGRDSRILGSGNSRGHGRSERGPQKVSYTGFLTDGEDHLLNSHCQVEFRSEISDS